MNHTIAFYSIIAIALVWNLLSCALDYRAQRFRRDEAERRRKRAIIVRHALLTSVVAALASRLVYLEAS